MIRSGRPDGSSAAFAAEYYGRPLALQAAAAANFARFNDKFEDKEYDNRFANRYGRR